MSERFSGVSATLVGADRLLPFYSSTKELGIPHFTARRLAAAGQVPTLKIGRQLFARESALRGLLASLQPVAVAA